MAKKLAVFFDSGKEYLKFSSFAEKLGIERRTSMRLAKRLGIKLVHIVGQGITNYIERSESEKFAKSIVVSQDLDKTRY